MIMKGRVMNCIRCEYYLECEREKERLAEKGIIFGCIKEHNDIFS